MSRRRSVTERLRMSSPPMVIVPAVGSMSRLIMRRVVVLPHPEGPIRITIEPPATAEVEWFDGRPIAAVERLRDAGEDDGAPVGHGRPPDASRVRSTGSSAADPPRTTRFPDVRRERPKRGTHIWVLIRCTLSPWFRAPAGECAPRGGGAGLRSRGRRRAPHGYVHRPGRRRRPVPLHRALRAGARRLRGRRRGRQRRRGPCHGRAPPARRHRDRPRDGGLRRAQHRARSSSPTTPTAPCS